MEKEPDIIVEDGLQDHSEGDEVQRDGILKARGKRCSRWNLIRVCGLIMLVFAVCASAVAIHNVKHQSALWEQGVSDVVSNPDEDGADEDSAGTVVSLSPNNRDLASCRKRTANAIGYATERSALKACLRFLYAHGCGTSCCVSSNGSYYSYYYGSYYTTCACGTSMRYDACP